jgi:hypothetical protein
MHTLERGIRRNKLSGRQKNVNLYRNSDFSSTMVNFFSGNNWKFGDDNGFLLR